MNDTTVGGRMRGVFVSYLLVLTVLWVIVLRCTDLLPKEGELIPRGAWRPATDADRIQSFLWFTFCWYFGALVAFGLVCGWPKSCLTFWSVPNGVSDGERRNSTRRRDDLPAALDSGVWYGVDNGRRRTGDGGLEHRPGVRWSGVGVETVRFYERQGCSTSPIAGRPATASSAGRRFIRRAKELGFTRKEITGLLALRLDAAATRKDVRREVRAKVADIEAKITDLQRMRDARLILVDQGHGDGAAAGCPILKALQGDDA